MPKLSEEELDAPTRAATVDADDGEEQLGGFAVMIEDNLEMPFETTDWVRDGQHQVISVLDLPLPEPPPKGTERIAACRHWASYA